MRVVAETAAEAQRLVDAPLLVLDSLERLLDEAGLGAGPLQAAVIGDGHSNYTFLLTRGPDQWILRRPPRPPFPPSTHDVLREHRILAACATQPARTPRPVLAVEDTSLLGVPFYLMEFVPGAVLTTALPREAAGHERTIAVELVTGLAEIHAIDWRACGLGGLGRGTGYLERQLRRFSGLWREYRARPIPAIDEAGRRLGVSRPESRETTLVHGDFRLGNTIFGFEPQVALRTIVDWEMAAIGDPLADLGYLVSTWAQPGDAAGVLLELGSVTATPAWPTREELASEYARVSGRAVDRLAWYEALACFKSAVLLEGSYQRLQAGMAEDPFFERLRDGVPQLAERALAALERD